MCCFPKLKAERRKLFKKKKKFAYDKKNNNRHIFNTFSVLLTSPVEAAIAGNENNELRRMMRRTRYSGQNLEPIEREREFCSSFECEQGSPIITISSLLQ